MRGTIIFCDSCLREIMNTKHRQELTSPDGETIDLCNFCCDVANRLEALGIITINGFVLRCVQEKDS